MAEGDFMWIEIRLSDLLRQQDEIETLKERARQLEADNKRLRKALDDAREENEEKQGRLVLVLENDTPMNVKKLIERSLAELGKDAVNRDTSLTKTKLEEALMWYNRYFFNRINEKPSPIV